METSKAALTFISFNQNEASVRLTFVLITVPLFQQARPILTKPLLYPEFATFFDSRIRRQIPVMPCEVDDQSRYQPETNHNPRRLTDSKQDD